MASAEAAPPDSTFLVSSTFHNGTLALTLATTPNSTMTAAPPPLSPEEEGQIEQYATTLRALKHSYMWVIFALGFPGNTFSLLVILGMRWWGSPALFMATLAVVDNLAIVVKLLLNQFGQHKAAIGHVGCKIMFFLGNHLVVYANWVLVAMAVERFFAVWQPLRVNHMWTSRKAAVSLAILLLITVALTAPLFVAVTVKDKDGVQICGIDSDYASVMRVWQSGQVIAYGFLPCLLLTTINILIIILITRAHRLHRSMTSSSKQSGTCNTSSSSGRHGSTGNIQRQATIMLVVTSAVLVLTTTPICVYMLLHKKWEPRKGTVDFARKELISFVLRVICDSNHSVNFYLYFVSARKFRSYFCKAMCFLCSRFVDYRQGSEANTHRFSTLRSALKAKGTGSEGHTMVFERKLMEEDGCLENGMQLRLYTEKGQNESASSVCGALL
ncbi:uncharacterized protein LOC143294003 [Babylonia areolata]|uniref:uncharacterized protein LOC143294003 n=1 Tax=Babylonia areolata TaxID=304850 RepID=UPI003FCF3C89